MENELQSIMRDKSDAELQEYLDNLSRHSSDEIEAVIVELQNRGRIFSEEELRTIRYQTEFRGQTETSSGENIGNPWAGNVVTDPNAPNYYSERAISIFTVLFGAFFGSILLASNIRKTEAKGGAVPVIFFGLAFSCLQYFLTINAPQPSTYLPILFGLLAALILRRYFWIKFIGENVKYRARPIWLPLFIGLAIIILLIAANMYTGNLVQ